MGRTLPVPVACQVCGDKSYGRHYGVFCCDGCSCFFKRSIRKNITYACISGDKTCIVDKARRNWCPACRLDRCYAVRMNKHAVQDERGPRKSRNGGENGTKRKSVAVESSKPKKITLDLANHMSLTKSSTLTSDEEVSKNMMECLKTCLNSPVLRFSDGRLKSHVLDASFHQIFLLHWFHANCNYQDVFSNDERVEEIRRYIEALSLDLQELHHCICLILCSSKFPGGESGSLSNLQEVYWMMLAHHCSIFYPTDILRITKIAHTMNALQKLQFEQIEPMLNHSSAFKQASKAQPEEIIAFLIQKFEAGLE